MRYIGGTVSTPQASWARLMRQVGQWAVLGYGYWLVETLDGQFVGEVGFGNFRRNLAPDPGDIPEAGWVIAPAQHGQGYGREAVRTMLDWADTQPGFDQSFAIFDADHARSLQLAHEMGFGGAQAARLDEATPLLLLTRPRGIICG